MLKMKKNKDVRTPTVSSGSSTDNRRIDNTKMVDKSDRKDKMVRTAINKGR